MLLLRTSSIFSLTHSNISYARSHVCPSSKISKINNTQVTHRASVKVSSIS